MMLSEILLSNVLAALGMLGFFAFSVAVLNYWTHDPDKTKLRHVFMKLVTGLLIAVYVVWIGWSLFSGHSGSVRHSYDEEQNFDPRG